MKDQNPSPKDPQEQIATKNGTPDVKNQISAHDLEGDWSEVRTQVAQLKIEFDALSRRTTNSSGVDAVPHAQTQRLGYRNAPVIISLTALLFSFGTTLVSYYRVSRQDLHDSRTELRALLQRLSAMPKENIEALNQPDKLVGAQLSSALNGEVILVSHQAVEVMNRIPSYVTANEYLVVAQALLSSGDFNQAQRLLEQAIAVSRSLNDEVAALRGYGSLLIASGNSERGREMYQRALRLRDKYPSTITYYSDWTDALTELHWAGAEFQQQHCQEGHFHLEKAMQIAASLAPGTTTDNLLQQLEAAQTKVKC